MQAHEIQTNAECGSVRFFFPARKVRAMTSAEKVELRKAARRKRSALASSNIAAALAAHAIQLKLAPGAIVGGYHALPEEADPHLLLQALVARRCHIAFPRIAGKGSPLEFHLVPDGEVLRPGAYGIAEPLAHWPRAVPDLLLVPLLAFDDRGHRLGYGGGFYDRTLFALKSGAALRVRAIGIAYAGQAVASLPAETHDMALDGVLTEQGLKEFP
jgi:5-formyltetrahydrofolate cyclo-ligase